MKRDWDLIRYILLTCEEAPTSKKLNANDFGDTNKAVLFEHVRLLTEAGYLDAKLMPLHTGEGGGAFVIMRLAWDGHDLLAKMRSDAWWAKIKNAAADKGLSLTFELIKSLALPAAKGLLGLDDA